MKLFLACLIIILMVIFGSTGSLAASESSPSAFVTDSQLDETLLHTVPLRFLPGEPFYFLITIKESFSRFFKPSAARRAEFDFILSEKRLKESYLLLKSGNNKKAESNLIRYKRRLAEMSFQIDKARSQNQDIAEQIAFIGDGFRKQEILLISINQEFIFDGKLESSIEAFSDAVDTIDILLPGLRNRFQLIKNRNISTEADQEEGDDLFLIEATPSANPRRIIL